VRRLIARRMLEGSVPTDLEDEQTKSRLEIIKDEACVLVV